MIWSLFALLWSKYYFNDLLTFNICMSYCKTFLYFIFNCSFYSRYCNLSLRSWSISLISQSNKFYIIITAKLLKVVSRIEIAAKMDKNKIKYKQCKYCEIDLGSFECISPYFLLFLTGIMFCWLWKETKNKKDNSPLQK